MGHTARKREGQKAPGFYPGLLKTTDVPVTWPEVFTLFPEASFTWATGWPAPGGSGVIEGLSNLMELPDASFLMLTCTSAIVGSLKQNVNCVWPGIRERKTLFYNLFIRPLVGML